MNSGIRIAYFLVAAGAMLVSGWFASRAISANLTTLRKWQRIEGTVVGLPALDYIGVELGQDPDTRRVTASADHMAGLKLFRRVTIYGDPSDPQRFRVGGILQLWLWPGALVALTAGCGLIAIAAVSLGRVANVDEVMSSGRWSFSPPPPVLAPAIVVHRPASETKAPLFWSLLGVVTFCCGVFIPAVNPFSRLATLLAGAVFMLGTWSLAAYNSTLRISAGASGLRAGSAFGWRNIPWDLIKSVERREAYPTHYRAIKGNSLPFPGNTTQSIVFAGANRQALLRMSTHMEPQEDARRLFDLCKQHTGLTEQFRRIEIPEI